MFVMYLFGFMIFNILLCSLSLFKVIGFGRRLLKIWLLWDMILILWIWLFMIGDWFIIILRFEMFIL